MLCKRLLKEDKKKLVFSLLPGDNLGISSRLQVMATTIEAEFDDKVAILRASYATYQGT